MFCVGITKVLSTLDSSKFCDYAIENLGFDSSCKTDSDGFLMIGIEQMIAAFLNEIN